MESSDRGTHTPFGSAPAPLPTGLLGVRPHRAGLVTAGKVPVLGLRVPQEQIWQPRSVEGRKCV